jgi:hypothetical protein
MSALGVNRVGLTVGPPLPIYPEQRTSLSGAGRSGSCPTAEVTVASFRRRQPQRNYAGVQSKNEEGVHAHRM